MTAPTPRPTRRSVCTHFSTAVGSAGIVAYDGEQFHSHRALGLVGDHFNVQSVMDRLDGNVAIGHVRYSTSGDTALRNVQPLFAEFKFGGFAVCHNGNLTNAYSIRKELVQRGCLFSPPATRKPSSISSPKANTVEWWTNLTDTLSHIEGAYSLVAVTQKKLIGVRDPWGSAAGARPPWRRDDLDVRDMRPGYHRSGVHSRCRTG